jgi:Ras-related protein Rab-8A
MVINGKTVTLKIWDTAGQERFRNITQQYYKNANGILLVFDVADRNSFEKVRDWMKQIQCFTKKESIAIVLIGNKCDVDNREVSTEEGQSLANEFSLKYFETSALNNTNIEEAFSHLTQDILRLKDFKDSIITDVPNKIIELKKTDKAKTGKSCC